MPPYTGTLDNGQNLVEPVFHHFLRAVPLIQGWAYPEEQVYQPQRFPASVDFLYDTVHEEPSLKNYTFGEPVQTGCCLSR